MQLSRTTYSRVAAYLRDAAVFAPCYVLLDWASYIDPVGPYNLTPWNPQPALAIVWMLLGGLIHAPAVFVTIFLADVVVRGAPAGQGITMLTALTLTLGYAGIAWALRTLLRPRPDLHTLRQLTRFVLVVVPATAAIGAAFVGVLYAAGLLNEETALRGWLRFWVGDAVGVLVTAPLLLMAADPARRKRLASLARRPEGWLQIGLLAAALWLIFEGLGGDPADHFFVLFLPLIWIAVRSGMAGAMVASAVVQLGVVLGIHHQSVQTLPIIELQALVAALTLTGLYLGLMVDERQRATEGLQQSLRLAAAGEMAGAIAHEVNQPLTALTNYCRSAQVMLGRGTPGAELAVVIDKMLAEAQRAAEVVRRLRDFFRAGTTRLEAVPVQALLDAAKRIAAQTAAGRPLSVRVEREGDLPALLIDRLQIELVLRNLIANAVEALEGAGPDGRPPAGEIRIVAGRHDAQHLRIVVADNGPGIPPATGERVFEPFISGKSTGMGLGLVVSRAIAEAHGGTLEAPFLPRAEFHLLLPFEPAHG